MQNKLLITNYKNFIISALLDEQSRFIEVNCDDEEGSILNNIYIGKVKNIVKNINAAFIEFEQDKIGYYDLETNKNPIILNKTSSKNLNIGDEILVQVIKDSVKTKDPVLTSNIELCGKYVIVTVNRLGVSFSKKIADKHHKLQIKAALEKQELADFGYLIRTNSNSASIDEILGEAKQLENIWNEIKKKACFRTCFSLLYKAPQTYLAYVRDIYDDEINKILTDNEMIFKEIKNHLQTFEPDKVSKLEFYQDEICPLHKIVPIEKYMEELTKERVWLKSGAYLIIQPTEALVVIDVNSGKSIANKSKKNEWIKKINFEAAKEIAVQIRLRNLSGIIIVDFINMPEESFKEELLQEFERHLNNDRIPTTIVDMTKLDLVEITRKKVKKPIYEQLRNC